MYAYIYVGRLQPGLPELATKGSFIFSTLLRMPSDYEPLEDIRNIRNIEFCLESHHGAPREMCHGMLSFKTGTN